MPAPSLQGIADKAGVSMDDAEKAWDKAKAAAKEQYPELSEEDDRFWAIVTGITKKMLGVNESFVDQCDRELAELSLLCEATNKNAAKE